MQDPVEFFLDIAIQACPDQTIFGREHVMEAGKAGASGVEVFCHNAAAPYGIEDVMVDAVLEALFYGRDSCATGYHLPSRVTI
jgi:hypothetical protein